MKNRIRNFEIQSKLGSGSYGVIYKALNKINREVCVLKQISLGRLSEKARKSAINEATIMGKLIHPFIVRYKESFIEDNTLNIVMEFCDSGDLSNYLKMQNKKPLKQEKIWKFFIEICIGLEYIHKNKILHRDIKTLNIFMNKNDEIKIGDLGVAKMLTSNEFAQTMVGTPFYLSPELCEEKPYNQKSDIWALGCMLYELCTYRHPFQAQTQPSLILKIIRGKYKYSPIPQFYSHQLKEIIDLCLERDYKRRPTTSNLLAKPKMQEYYKIFGMEKIVEDYMAAVRNEKEANRVVPKSVEEVKAVQPKEKIIKAIDYKEIKKEEVVKKEQPKREEVKKEVIVNKPLQPQTSQKKIEKQVVQKRVIVEEVIPRKDHKNEFAANLERMIDQSNKKIIKQGPSYAEIQPKITEVVKKEEKYQRVLSKVEEIKKDHKIGQVKSPIIDGKKFTPLIHDKKSAGSMDVIPSSKKQELQPKPSNLKPPLAKPPMPPSAQKEPIKVKNEKVIQPKVYQSQKAISKPQVIIKSGGFNPIAESQQKNDKVYHPPSSSKDKHVPERNIASAKRPSLPGIVKQEKLQNEDLKQLFGIIQSPTIEHKSQKNLKNIVSSIDDPKPAKKQQIGVNVSRVRKGGPNVLSRNARNVSRYNQISKQEKDEVMNLPNKLNNRGNSSSDSQQEIYTRRNHVIEDLKGKTNKKFKLKEVDNDLVLQKYEDLMKSEEGQNSETVPNDQTQSEEQIETSNHFQQELKDDIEKDQIIEAVNDDPENIVEELQFARKSSGNSAEQIEEVLQAEIQEQNLQKEQNLDQQFQNQDYVAAQEKEEWSFDEEPELPLLQEKQSPYFEQNNPYLIQHQPQQQTQENKINYLQTKLSQNLKREDEINKLMQIKIDQCRKFIGNQKAFQEILIFFRKKLNMDDQYNEQDEKQIENFLKRKGLTDHRKFQNIYKIMHFQMELENTRTIIQRICKKLNELSAN